MIEIIDKKNCCGCEACVQVCMINCISMKQDNEGFYYPVVDENQCIECGKCKTICPIINKQSLKNDDIETYIAYSKNDEERLNSSSGGIFSLLATEILKERGIVFGAGVNEFNEIEHLSIDKFKDLKILQGSKYVQSRINKTYIDVKKYLLDNKSVLFSGTACQIAGLKKYLGKEYEKLYTVDVLCHGVPSPKVWHNYLREKEKEYCSKAKKVYFRNKKCGWKKYMIVVEFENNTSYEEFFVKDKFMQLFLNDICLRPSCYECKFKDMNRPSDITIGDCWGVERHHPEMDDNMGTSAVFIHSEKGKKLFEKISVKLMYVKSELDLILPPTSASRISVKPHNKREKFFELFDEGASVEQLCLLLQPNLLRRVIIHTKKVAKKFLKKE